MPMPALSLTAIPMLASTWILAPSITSGRRRRSRIRSAVWRPSSPGAIGDHERELVAAQADEQVRRADAGRQRRGPPTIDRAKHATIGASIAQLGIQPSSSGLKGEPSRSSAT